MNSKRGENYSDRGHAYLDGGETERLKIRKLEPQDAKIWEAFFINNPNLPYLGFDISKPVSELAQEWINIQLNRYETNRYGHQVLIDKVSGTLIGQCGLLAQEVEGKSELEVGYHILPQYWGKGYATEAAIHFRDFAFENHLADSLISVIDIRNKASMHVAEKIGMTIDKKTRCFDLDVCIYRISDSQWLLEVS